MTAPDADEDRVPLFASVAKAKVGTSEAVQLHGGIGMSDHCDIGFLMKRARAAQETFGDAAFHGDRIATIMGY